MSKGPQQKMEESRQRGYSEAEAVAQKISDAVDADNADLNVGPKDEEKRTPQTVDADSDEK